MGHQFAALVEAPFDADDASGLVVAALVYRLGQRFGNVKVEGAGQHGELALRGQRLQAGDNGHRDARVAAALLKLEILLVIKKHLGHDVVGSPVDLVLEKAHVGGVVRGLKVFFGVAGRADAKVGSPSIVLLLVEVGAFVEVGHLANQVAGVGVTIGLGLEMAFGFDGVATQGQHVVDAEEMQVNQRVLGFLFRKAAADEVGHGVHIKPVFNGRADAYRAGPAAHRFFLEQAVGVVAVHVLLTVISYVDKWRFKLHQRLNIREQREDVLALFRWENFKGKQGFALGLFEVFGNFHGIVARSL